MRAIGPVALDQPVHEALIIRAPPIVLFAAAAMALAREALKVDRPQEDAVQPQRGIAVDQGVDVGRRQRIERRQGRRSEEHTSELQSLMRTSYAVFCLKKKKHDELRYNT